MANMAKPGQPEAASVILSRIEQLLRDVASWSDERVWLTVTDEHRRQRFTLCAWDRRTVELADLAVWPGMGGLPPAATRGSAADTARHLLKHGIPQGAARLRALVAAARSDPAGVERVCRALPLIAVEHGMLFTGQRRRLFFTGQRRRLSWALDDGSHRAVALALISTSRDVDVLIGTRRGET